MEIHDDGQGFEDPDPDTDRGLGLSGMEKGRGSCSLFPPCDLHLDRERKTKSATLAELALDPNPTTVSLHDSLEGEVLGVVSMTDIIRPAAVEADVRVARRTASSST